MHIEFHILGWPVPGAFRQMTFALHGEMLGQAEAVAGVLPIGALAEGKAVGFGLARTVGQSGEVMSLFVAPELWGNGIGTKLLEELENGLSRWDCRRVEMAYSTESPATARLERLLMRRGWSPPVTRMVLVQIVPRMAESAHWIGRTQVPVGFEVFAWGDWQEEERAALEAVRGEITPALWPFAEEARAEPVCSLGLRCEGNIAGWMVCHRITPELIRFTSLYVRKRWRTPQATFGLLAEALRRKDAHYGDGVLSTLAVQIENERMLRLTERKFRPYAHSWSEMRVAEKPLSGGS